MASVGASSGPLHTKEDIAFQTKEFIDNAKIDQLYVILGHDRVGKKVMGTHFN